MPANWSLILNILLLIGVIIAIGRLMKTRRESLNSVRYQPRVKKVHSLYEEQQPFLDDIIAVRKINTQDNVPEEAEKAKPQIMHSTKPEEHTTNDEKSTEKNSTPKTLMIFLLAKKNCQFAGYELLQTVLAAGLRFGEGALFHRHQLQNGQGPILCSLATATATGVFDLQNVGALSVRGLCLFMHISKDPNVNTERFSIMLETARQLSDSLNAHLLDEQRKPLSSERITHYCTLLNIKQELLDPLE